MELDKDYIREILLELEASPHDPSRWFIPDHCESPRKYSYHIHLLSEAGMVAAVDLSSSDGHDWKAMRLTYQGHEFLDSVRDNEVWKLTKAGAQKAGVAGLEFIWSLSRAYTRQVAKDRLGIDLG